LNFFEDETKNERQRNHIDKTEINSE